jgi:alpha-tubulin suppressor-like RCC1 family protein
VCGPTDTAIVLSDGRCYVSGLNKQGQLGLGHKNATKTPTLLPNMSVKSISLGQNSSALIDTNGELYTFGNGGSTLSGVGQLGHGDAESYLEPKLVDSVVEDGCFTKQVEVGETHTAVLTTEGEILCTGAGSYGRLGNFETVDQLFLEPVELLVSGVNQIAAGKSFTLALKDGLVHGWGRNHKGQVCGEKLFLCGIDAFDHIVSCSKTCRFV